MAGTHRHEYDPRLFQAMLNPLCPTDVSIRNHYLAKCGGPELGVHIRGNCIGVSAEPMLRNGRHHC